MKLLEKARKLNRLMQNGERVKYKEVALLLKNLISSNVYVIDVNGTILGYSLLDEFECGVMRDMVLADQRFPEKYMELVRETTETNSNISHKEQMCSFIDDKKCMYGEKRTTIVPVNGNGERIATLILARYDRDFNDDDLLLAEYAAAVIGVEILREREVQVQENARKKAMVQIAFSTLSFSEWEAIVNILAELKGTEGIVRNEIPEAEVIGTADNEASYWRLIKQQQPDLVLLDLGLGGSTTVGVEICRQTKELYKQVKILIFTGEILNEKLWVDVLDAGADGIILKTGELLTRRDVMAVMEGKQLVFNEPILQKIVDRFKHAVSSQLARQEALINYEIDEYDERFLRHLALGFTKEQITGLRGMPFGVKSLEKRQLELVRKLFPGGESVNATRLVVRALELRILDIDNLEADME